MNAVGTKEIEGEKYFVIAPTSQYDSIVSKGSHRGNAGWIKDGNSILIPESDVKKAVVYIKSDNGTSVKNK